MKDLLIEKPSGTLRLGFDNVSSTECFYIGIDQETSDGFWLDMDELLKINKYIATAIDKFGQRIWVDK